MSAPFYIFGEYMGFPIIGVTTYQGKNEEGYPIAGLQNAYVESLVHAGAIPLLIPSKILPDMVERLLSSMDGILFTGGGDIAIDRFNEEPNEKIANVDHERDSIEFSLLNIIVTMGKPFLGICRGFQMINVALGGTLFTDLEDQKPDAIKHDYYPGYPRTFLAHQINVKNGTRLAALLEESDILVNSLHHQGAKDISNQLVKSAFAPDGLVEGVELSEYPFGVAVQWHPEWLTDQQCMRRLFTEFVKAAAKSS